MDEKKKESKFLDLSAHAVVALKDLQGDTAKDDKNTEKKDEVKSQ